jgi:AbrB family transcriptional regulator (stage V sporulation protein T)
MRIRAVLKTLYRNAPEKATRKPRIKRPKSGNTDSKTRKKEQRMKATGIVRRIDELGRIVIPKEIRRVLRIREGDPIEIFTDADGVVLKKYARIRELGDYADTYCQALTGALGFSAAVTDTETILFAAGSLRKKLQRAALSDSFVERMRARQSILAPEGFPLLSGETPALRIGAVPIVSSGDVLGSVLIATDEPRLKLSETELEILKTAALYLGKQLE